MSEGDNYTDFAITGPDFDVKFSAVDQAVPGVYSGRVLIFKRNDGDEVDATLAIRDGLRKTVEEVPILAGEMSYSPFTGWVVKKGHLRLRVTRLPQLDYGKLEATNFDEALIPADLVSSVPTLMDPPGEWHTCRIQVNFITGGLLFVISVHHLVADGWGVTKVIENIARNCRLPDERPRPQAPPLLYADRSRLSTTTIQGKGDISKVPSYSIVPLGTPWSPVHPGVVTTSFRFPAGKLTRLKAASFPDQTLMPGVWVTTHDAVLALWLRTYVRTRYFAGRITREGNIRFSFPIEFRRHVGLSAEYIGNAVFMHKINIPVERLLNDDGLKYAALVIRQGMKGVGPDYIENFIAVAKGVLEDPLISMRINLKFDDVDRAFGCTTYKNFAHGELDWDRKVFGVYQRLRLPSGIAGEGVTVVMPVLKDGDWELTTMVESELLHSFTHDEEWKLYTVGH